MVSYVLCLLLIAQEGGDYFAHLFIDRKIEAQRGGVTYSKEDQPSGVPGWKGAASSAFPPSAAAAASFSLFLLFILYFKKFLAMTHGMWES